MSQILLNRVKDHVAPLLTGYGIRFYRWSDDDLNGAGSIALFRMSGTNGPSSHITQWPDVSIYLLADPDAVVQADNDMLAILRYLRSDYEAANVLNMVPVGTYTGPMYLDNGRAMFECVVRVGVEDH